MNRIPEPDYNIIIRIKDGEIVKVDWSELVIEFKNASSVDEITKGITKYLRKAIKFIKWGR